MVITGLNLIFSKTHFPGQYEIVSEKDIQNILMSFFKETSANES